MKTGQLSQR